MCPGGGLCARRARGGFWGGCAAPHPCPTDLWGLPDGADRAGSNPFDFTILTVWFLQIIELNDLKGSEKSNIPSFKISSTFGC